MIIKKKNDNNNNNNNSSSNNLQEKLKMGDEVEKNGINDIDELKDQMTKWWIEEKQK